MDKMLLDLLAGDRRLERHGYQLRVLSAWELLQARREAEELGADPETAGLRHNAGVLCRAVVRGNTPVFSTAAALLRQWSAEKVAQEMAVYREFARQIAPDCGDSERTGILLEQLRQEPEERIRWKVLKTLGVLPSEARAREMTWGDYLYCALQLMLDREEQLEKLCPQCRSRAEESQCSLCGREITGETGKNPAFDEKRFEEMKRGG